ncbi:IS66 family transposase [Novosphingobium panipatense]|uniref:IS66 family transposase n=1 Tax=Novosphingobium panipatense TaxID=428991 RepID=UPI00361FA279
MAKACRYPLNRWAAMVRYCEDGLLEISNNLVENALRGVALGRRNWMFVGSIKGGDASALFYSLAETCRLNGVEPEAWFTDVIARIGNHPINRIDEPCHGAGRPYAIRLRLHEHITASLRSVHTSPGISPCRP